MTNPTGPPAHRRNLLGPPPTHLPADGADRSARTELSAGRAPAAVAAEVPESSLAWALLADAALDRGDLVSAYAFARTGYHRGLDALRRAGWKGAGEVPFAHEPNQGFLRALLALGEAASGIDERAEAERIAALITDCDPDASRAAADLARVVSGSRPVE